MGVFSPAGFVEIPRVIELGMKNGLEFLPPPVA
jgi:hypothetical protein